MLASPLQYIQEVFKLLCATAASMQSNKKHLAAAVSVWLANLVFVSKQ